MVALDNLRILIVGAGPIGLTAAAALSQDGHDVKVLERYPNLQTNGGTIVVQSPAARALKEIGLWEKLQSISVPNKSFSFWSYKDPSGPMITFGRSSGSDMVHTDRPALQRIAYEAAVASGVHVLFGKRVERLDEDATPLRVWTADDQEYTADIIIGADGIKSGIRKLLFPSQILDPVLTTECIFQAQLSEDVTASDPRIAPYMDIGSGHGTLGPGRFTFFRATDDGKLYLLFVVMNYGTTQTDGVSASWNTPGDIDELRSIFSEFGDPLHACLEHVESCIRWPIAVAPPLKTWRGVSGRVLLLGDAAHAMVPHAANGVSQGIEGAVALARLLRRRNHANANIPKLLELFEQFRRPRVEKFATMSLGNAAANSLTDGPEQESRDARYRAMNNSSEPKPVAAQEPVTMDINAPQHSPAFQKWMNEYDVVHELDRFVDEKLV
ncbi:hypothetical protein BKA67DRAFT_284225 [Truncatella angustata]|uniref:FAD-binding domain-containing protein n=1 Tax=Truncatella angustata TaxID=152316 RepID=A0A9P8UMB2_9PEZI|nr:uncharacterized protein BKA67DRAFT_284225 [Truncatella angustata]KAH6654607.1 hypothetical protein BKA67DRAFT_284225 [Truncatella angustata]KAH8203348.1 hypothetical protein TruAng_002443 [Truncatella angustata]